MNPRRTFTLVAFQVRCNKPDSATLPFTLVRIEGLEPPRLAASGPKPGASTNFAISALTCVLRKYRALHPIPISFYHKPRKLPPAKTTIAPITIHFMFALMKSIVFLLLIKLFLLKLPLSNANNHHKGHPKCEGFLLAYIFLFNGAG